MDEGLLAAFFDELEKTAGSSGVGSRGGKVVGYRKSGDPIYASERDKDKVPMKKPPIVARGVQGAMGAGMITAQAPLVTRYLKGRASLYHGTSPEAAQSIFSTEKGIDPSFAGAGQRASELDYISSVDEKRLKDLGLEGAQELGSSKKKAMINRYLMAESLNRLIDKHKLPLTHEQLSGNLERFQTLMDDGMKSGEAATKVFSELMAELKQTGKVTNEQASSIANKMQDELSRHGQRVYMGYSPTDVRTYSTGKSEAQKVLQKVTEAPTPKGQLGQQLRNVAEVVTGGLPTTVKNSLERLKYKPSSVESMTVDQVQGELAKLRNSGNKVRVVIGASVPTGKMGYLADFPVVRHLLGANPGLRYSLANIGFETYEAGKDTSFPHAVPRKNIQSVDLIDEATGKIRRILVSGAQKAQRSRLLPRLRGAALPAALTALGGYNIYRALRPKEKLVHKSHPLAVKPDDTEKRGSVSGDVGRVARRVLPIAAGAGALGYGAHVGLEKLLPKRYPETTTEEVLEVPRMLGRVGGGSLAAAGVSAGVGAGIGALRPHRLLGRRLSSQFGAIAGGTAGGLFGSAAAQGRETAMLPEADPHFSYLPDSAQDWIRKHPGVGSLKNVAMAAALPVGGAFTLRKYYPGTYATLVKNVRESVA